MTLYTTFQHLLQKHAKFVLVDSVRFFCSDRQHERTNTSTELRAHGDGESCRF